MIKILICCGTFIIVGIITSYYLMLIEKIAFYVINK
jgi:hypothetical protein